MRLPVEEACAAAASDGEFRIASRFWNATVRFECGGVTQLLEIHDGAPRAVADDAAITTSLTIGATADVWEKMLAATPTPFYHDLFAAVVKHGVTLDASEGEARTAYYPAMRRFVELMRNARTSGQV